MKRIIVFIKVIRKTTKKKYDNYMTSTYWLLPILK